MTLPPRVADWPEAWRANYEERAALMQDGASYGRQDCELHAEACVRMEAARTPPVSRGTLPYGAPWPWQRPVTG